MDAVETQRREAEAILAMPRERFVQALVLNCWLLEEARHSVDAGEMLAGIVRGLNRAGVPVDRLANYVVVRHSQRAGIARVWRHDGPLLTLPLSHEDADRLGDRASPFSTVLETGEPLEIDLEAAPADLFPIVADLQADGYRGYYCVPVKLSNGLEAAVAYATKRSGGFDDDDHAVLDFLEPAVAALIEILVTRRILNEVTRIYLGVEPTNRVLAGDTRRGQLVGIKSAIMFSDMRGFTSHSMRLKPEDTVALLNAYYDCVVGPVEERGGEVLKFIGDGVLAIFRMEDHDSGALSHAIDASRAALAEVDRVNAAGTAPAPFEVGIGLHLGLAGYGNVGSGERQDYTVIGSDVNLASRVAGLCGQLGRPLLLTEPMAKRCHGSFAPIGDYPLKGIDGDRTIYAPVEA